MGSKKFSAFPDGNSYVHFNNTINRLIIANSEGLIKVFNTEDSESEPISIDILDNLTSVTSNGDKNLVLTTTDGKLELVDLTTNTSKGVLHRSELPLRDTVFINQGNRVLCGGDENKLTIIDLQTNDEDDNKITNITLPDQLLNISYNYAGELASVSLSNGDVQIYSVVNEQPNLLHTLKNILPSKIHVSMDKVDFNEEHHDELLSTSTEWSQNGQYLLVPTVDNSIQVYDRQDWNNPIKNFKNDSGKIIDFKLLPLGKLAILSLNVFKVFDFDSGKLIHEDDFDFDEDAYPLNLDWKDGTLFVGSTNGETLQLDNVVLKSKDVLTSLFVSDAEDDEAEEPIDAGNETDELLRKSDDEQDIDDLENDDIDIRKNVVTI